MKQTLFEQMPVGTRITYKDTAEDSVKNAECFRQNGYAYVHSYVNINRQTHKKYGGLCKYAFWDNGGKSFWAVRFVSQIDHLKTDMYFIVPADQVRKDEAYYSLHDNAAELLRQLKIAVKHIENIEAKYKPEIPFATGGYKEAIRLAETPKRTMSDTQLDKFSVERFWHPDLRNDIIRIADRIVSGEDCTLQNGFSQNEGDTIVVIEMGLRYNYDDIGNRNRDRSSLNVLFTLLGANPTHS